MRPLALTLLISLGGCAAFQYARVEPLPLPAGAPADAPRGLEVVRGKRVGLVAITLPVDVEEQLVGVQARFEEDLIRALHAHGGIVTRPGPPVRRVRERRIVENELYGWFFKSDSAAKERLVERIDPGALDLLAFVDVLQLRRGTVRASSWVELNVQLHEASTGRLVELVDADGFWDAVMEAMAAAPDAGEPPQVAPPAPGAVPGPPPPPPGPQGREEADAPGSTPYGAASPAIRRSSHQGGS